MKMFVWEDPYPVPYGSSLVVAVAETLPEARKIALARFDGLRHIKDTIDLKKPARVLDVPGASWHSWEE